MVGRGGPCYGRLAFMWRIEYIQDLPGAARSLHSKSACARFGREAKIYESEWFLLDESELVSFDH